MIIVYLIYTLCRDIYKENNQESEQSVRYDNVPGEYV